MSIINVISSTLYATNAIAAHAKKEMVYSLVSSVLLGTSWLFHATRNEYLGWIDKCAVYSFIAYGLYHLINKNCWRSDNRYLFLVCIITASISSYLYYYGYFTKTFCHDPEFGDYFHALLHGFSSLGHHANLLLH
jgi:hypothetical protein